MRAGLDVIHPVTGQNVQVVKVTMLEDGMKVWFKAKGQHGWFKIPNSKEEQ